MTVQLYLNWVYLHKLGSVKKFKKSSDIIYYNGLRVLHFCNELISYSSKSLLIYMKQEWDIYEIFSSYTVFSEEVCLKISNWDFVFLGFIKARKSELPTRAKKEPDPNGLNRIKIGARAARIFLCFPQLKLVALR